MHELSIAMNIMNIASEALKNENLETIKEIEIDVGTQSGVLIDSLKFAFEMTVKDTLNENIKLTINKIQAKSKCRQCGKVFKIEEYYTPCPKCGSFDSGIIQGKELKVKSLFLD
ncbi:MAG: hydrogenase maturation nickel metallochaperone HypA [Saprospiraceae bacterium]|nr:hydrogenase maturation nickel metallochaperone HypA [Saprospiraceae bacterium]